LASPTFASKSISTREGFPPRIQTLLLSAYRSKTSAENSRGGQNLFEGWSATRIQFKLDKDDTSMHFRVVQASVQKARAGEGMRGQASRDFAIHVQGYLRYSRLVTEASIQIARSESELIYSTKGYHYESLLHRHVDPEAKCDLWCVRCI
jgi:hypothetical protein